MLLITEKVSILTNSKADIFIKEEDLDFLLDNEEARKKFLQMLGTQFIEVEPLGNAVAIDDITFVKYNRDPQIKSLNHSNWGCSHAIST